MPLSRSLRIGMAAVLLWSCFAYAGRATASPSSMGVGVIPQVFRPVVSRFARSPIPVFFPTWIPRSTFKVYSGKIYPLFCTFKRQYRTGPGYELGLYTNRRFCDHAHRLIEFRGIAGDEYSVSSRTHPVWLGKSGWAYVDPDHNAGWTISFVRAVGHTRWPPTYLPEYTYTVLGACGDLTLKRIVACLRHIAASVRRYTAHPSRG